jgi:hypothetical protein
LSASWSRVIRRAPFVKMQLQRSSLPLVDLGDTRRGQLGFSSYSCGRAASGHEVVYRVDLSSQMTIEASVVDHDGVDVDVAILAGAQDPNACAAYGDHGAVATVGPGTVYVVVDSKTVANEGDFVVVIERQ